MHFFRSFHDIPELAALPEQEREQAWRKVQGHNLIMWQTWLSLVLACLLAGIGEYLGERLGAPGPGLAVGAAIGGFVFWQSGFHIARYQYLASLARAARMAKKNRKR
ncbi:hypothetical protein [Paludibacterium yongneupense]|uniref:hypothetical protein n=1 Tax=Paludibacterium yongneupense TaxID=400061 RepID=UPI0003F7941C|nr:hypothetical protein [Paludibacterium yongneupense]